MKALYGNPRCRSKSTSSMCRSKASIQARERRNDTDECLCQYQMEVAKKKRPIWYNNARTNRSMTISNLKAYKSSTYWCNILNTRANIPLRYKHCTECKRTSETVNQSKNNRCRCKASIQARERRNDTDECLCQYQMEVSKKKRPIRYNNARTNRAMTISNLKAYKSSTYWCYILNTLANIPLRYKHCTECKRTSETVNQSKNNRCRCKELRSSSFSISLPGSSSKYPRRLIQNNSGDNGVNPNDNRYQLQSTLSSMSWNANTRRSEANTRECKSSIWSRLNYARVSRQTVLERYMVSKL